MWLPELEQMIVVSPWSSLSPGLDGSRHSEELVCALIPLFIQFVSAPQWPTFSSVEHRSLNPCWCFPACFQIQMSGEWRGSDVEEWARAVCTEFVPTKPGVELDVPGGNGKLCLAVQGWKLYLPASPASKLLCRNVSASLAPVPVSLFSAQLRHLSHARGPLLGACSGQGDSGRGTVAMSPRAWLRCVGLGCWAVCAAGGSSPTHGPAAQPSTGEPSALSSPIELIT